MCANWLGFCGRGGLDEPRLRLVIEEGGTHTNPPGRDGFPRHWPSCLATLARNAAGMKLAFCRPLR